jgi:hypothetical protein
MPGFMVRCGTLLLLAGCGITPPTAPDAMPIDPPPPDTVGAAVVQAGSFVGLAGHSARGGVTVSISGNAATITLDSTFSSTSVPDPYVYLNTTANANTGQPLRISRLGSRLGAQVYTVRIPVGVAYSHVLVWCDAFNVGVGAAVLSVVAGPGNPSGPTAVSRQPPAISHQP